MLSLEVFLLTYCFIALIKIMCDRREALSWRLTIGNAITDDCWSDFYVIKFTHCCQNSLFCKLMVREWNWILRKLKTARFFNPLKTFDFFLSNKLPLSDYLFLDQWQSCISMKGPWAASSWSDTSNHTLTWWECLSRIFINNLILFKL